MADGSSVTNDDQNSQPAKQEQRVVFGVILILFKSPLFDLMGQTISNGSNLSRCISVEEEDISSNYMCYSTAKELWDSVIEMYLDLGNKSQIYELTLQAREIRQGGDNVTRYFHYFNTYKWKSAEDAKHHQQTVEEGRAIQFLAGLNEELDEVHGRIIGRATLPPLGEIFAVEERKLAGV
ncbi:hypothetical protein GYH30_022196 [Glycine max]|uniref:Retrotransposon gag domain-containing protein n=1 Tax=Glycine max TaxID=3847 RepID=K7L8H3_SOYBN|nr:hypothetical protein GYH30_022196 [Glycine max]